MKKIAVYLEEKNGSLKRGSAEAICAALSLGAPVVGLSIGSRSLATQAAEYGLAEVVKIEHAALTEYSSQFVAAALTQAAQAEGADAVFFAANSSGKELAPRVAVRMQAALLCDAVELKLDASTLLVTRPIFAGKALDTVKGTTENVVLSLRPNVFTARKADSPAASVERSFAPTLDASAPKVVVKQIVRNEGKLDVLEADTIVSGGRGMKGPEHFDLIEKLASSLGAAVGASRAVVDAGWRPHGEQVGQTGKTVSPKLYVACGISGAVQHLAGMSSSKIIVAVNKDKDAPIFKVADYGIVGDVFDVLPKLTEQIARITEKH